MLVAAKVTPVKAWCCMRSCLQRCLPALVVHLKPGVAQRALPLVQALRVEPAQPRQAPLQLGAHRHLALGGQRGRHKHVLPGISPAGTAHSADMRAGSFDACPGGKTRATTMGCSRAESACEPSALTCCRQSLFCSYLCDNKLEGSERFPQVINVIRAEAQMSLSTDWT